MAVWFPVAEDQPTRLLGRDSELEAIEQQLLQADVRLLSLVGPAGVGKTRLALEAASRLTGRFPDGAALVDLSPVRDAALVPVAMGQALGLGDITGGTPLSHLCEHLRDRTALLVLDNFEQVISAGAALADLLGAAPGLSILVTSRWPLRLRWERTLRVPPLPVPGPDTALSIDQLLQLPSVALFVDRAQAQRSDYVPTERHATVLARLARRLDGLPLAIELAAANISVQPLGVIARHLDRRLATVQWEAQDLPDRQRSLSAAIGWSYDLLSSEEKRLFRLLGVFVGQVSLDAIDAVSGARNDGDVVAHLISLAQKSLVLPLAPQSSETGLSFRMLETVRQYARDELDARGELDAAQQEHARYFLALAKQADPCLRGRDQLAWYRRLASEHDNFRAALRWFLDHGHGEEALRLAAALGYFWWTYGYHGEGWHWLEEALRRAPDADPVARVTALARAGTLLMYGGDLEQARVVLDESLALARRHAMDALISLPLGHQGLRAALAGDLAESLHLLQEAQERAKEQGDDSQLSFTYAALGYRSLVAGNYQEAADLYRTSIGGFQALGNEASANVVRISLAVAKYHLGEQNEAVIQLQRALRFTRASKNRWPLSHELEATVVVIGDRLEAERRASLLGALDTLAQATGALSGPLLRVSGQDDGEEREQLQEERLQKARKAGRLMLFEEAVELALDVLDEFSETLDHIATVVENPSPLSSREREVLRLVAEGLTSKQIGQQLFLSPRTVDHHLTAVFNKLGVDTRAQAVAVAAREGFLTQVC